MNYLTFWAESLARSKGISFKEDQKRKKKDGRWVTGLILALFLTLIKQATVRGWKVTDITTEQ